MKSIWISLLIAGLLPSALALAADTVEDRVGKLESKVTVLEQQPVRGCANFKPDCSISSGTHFWEKSDATHWRQQDRTLNQACEGQTIRYEYLDRYTLRLVRLSCPGMLPDCFSVLVDNDLVTAY